MTFVPAATSAGRLDAECRRGTAQASGEVVALHDLEGSTARRRWAKGFEGRPSVRDLTLGEEISLEVEATNRRIDVRVTSAYGDSR